MLNQYAIIRYAIMSWFNCDNYDNHDFISSDIFTYNINEPGKPALCDGELDLGHLAAAQLLDETATGSTEKSSEIHLPY